MKAKILTLGDLRKLVKAHSTKWTVIQRDGKLVVREDVGSPRHVDYCAGVLVAVVGNLLDEAGYGRRRMKPNSFHGRKSLYSNWWSEAIIG